VAALAAETITSPPGNPNGPRFELERDWSGELRPRYKGPQPEEAISAPVITPETPRVARKPEPPQIEVWDEADVRPRDDTRLEERRRAEARAEREWREHEWAARDHAEREWREREDRERRERRRAEREWVEREQEERAWREQERMEREMARRDRYARRSRRAETFGCDFDDPRYGC
jgi:hypothetical protein